MLPLLLLILLLLLLFPLLLHLRMIQYAFITCFHLLLLFMFLLYPSQSFMYTFCKLFFPGAKSLHSCLPFQIGFAGKKCCFFPNSVRRFIQELMVDFKTWSLTIYSKLKCKEVRESLAYIYLTYVLTHNTVVSFRGAK